MTLLSRTPTAGAPAAASTSSPKPIGPARWSTAVSSPSEATPAIEAYAAATAKVKYGAEPVRPLLRAGPGVASVGARRPWRGERGTANVPLGSSCR